MVWFHPGAFQYGESDDYDPTALVKRGFVVVTVNYRLGALGFMAHPALTAESSRHASGNYGLQDQQAALRWVQRNIRSFDGDASNVTIFGESAGGVSVYAHLASPDSAGLFHRAIAQSGAYFVYTGEPTLAAAEASGQAYATAVGCPQQDLACLRAVPVSTLLANQSTSPNAYLPTTDGAVLPTSMFMAFYNGQFNKVPVLQGTTEDEYRLFVALQELNGFPTNAETYHERIVSMLGFESGTASAMVNIFYTASEYGSEALALSALGTDIVFSCRALSLAHYLGKQVPVWLYEFSDPNAPQEVLPPVSFPYGSYHTSEIQYLLDAPDGPAPLNAGQKQLADTMKSYWTQFARTGNPNGGTAPVWPAYQDQNVFDPNGVNTFMQLSLTPTPFNQLKIMTDHGCMLFGPPYTIDP